MPRLSAEPIVISAAHEQVATRPLGPSAHHAPEVGETRSTRSCWAWRGWVFARARQLGVWPKTVRHWLGRWRTATEATPVAQRLADVPRPGAPATFTPEELCAIVASACEQPSAERDLPLSHWSRSELARCAIERGFVGRISNSSVGCFFKPNFTHNLQQVAKKIGRGYCALSPRWPGPPRACRVPGVPVRLGWW
jgi:hypothetical protein